ncbi:MAG TPA: adenosylcobinamide-phosphate synthase CbiB [Chloroflexota bacterium]|nr:adenosylcobinamide-phosphate synthase CbiB [Chloroflexota bacterium]
MVVGALAFDLLVGEPPTNLHPVVWMGALIDAFERRQPDKPGSRQVWGILLLVVGITLSFGLSWLLLRALNRVSPVARLVAAIILLKTTFAAGQLGRQALQVKRALDSGRISDARSEAQHLVSRRTATLSPRQVMAATIESVAENTLDSIVAPLFWFLLLGVPGAMAYRFVNTADAMIGYHGQYEYLGKAAARLDDALNWVPARLTAGLLIVASWLAGLRTERAWQLAQRDHALTESPNAGWAMAAAAGALAVPLEKTGHYRLGDDSPRNLIPRKIADAVVLMSLATVLTVAAIALVQAFTRLGALPWLA